jgi:hypothetical protein
MQTYFLCGGTREHFTTALAAARAAYKTLKVAPKTGYWKGHTPGACEIGSVVIGEDGTRTENTRLIVLNSKRDMIPAYLRERN